MIRTLRNSGLGQIFLGTIVVAIILAFVLTGVQGTGETTGDDCAVKVGKTCISPKEYRAAYQLLTSVGLNDSAAKRLQLRKQVGLGLAEREVLVEEALSMGLATSEDDIDRELLEGRTRLSLPAENAERLALSLAMCIDGPTGCAPGTIGLRAINVKQNGAFDFELYKRTVRVVSGRSPNHFKEMQQREYTAERMRNLIRSQVRVSPEEAFLAYTRARSKATGRVVHAKTAWFQRHVTAPSEEEVAAWIEKNQAAVDAAAKETAEKWKVGCAVVSEIRLNSADPTSEEAEEVKKKAEMLQAQAKAGADFQDLARRNSEGDSAVLGGRVGCLDTGYGAGAATLIDAAAELEKPGTVSSVVESIRGFHILELLDYVKEENKDELVRNYVGYKLASEALAKDAAEKFTQTLIERAKAGEALEDATPALVKKTLEDAGFVADLDAASSHEDAPKMEISRSVTIEQNPIDGSISEESPAVTLFALEKPDDVAKAPIATRDGFSVLQLKEKDMITREKFEEERDSIMISLQQRKAEQALAKHVANLIEKAGGVTLNPKHIPTGDADEAQENDS